MNLRTKISIERLYSLHYRILPIQSRNLIDVVRLQRGFIFSILQYTVCIINLNTFLVMIAITLHTHCLGKQRFCKGGGKLCNTNA
jgi:hypothetical protein